MRQSAPKQPRICGQLWQIVRQGLPVSPAVAMPGPEAQRIAHSSTEANGSPSATTDSTASAELHSTTAKITRISWLTATGL